MTDPNARIAPLYDRVVGPLLRPVHLSMAGALANNGRRSVLDLCCGTGLLAGMAADRGFKAVGVDISPAMLAVARANHPAAAFIDDDSFDAAAISFALHEKPEKTALAILAEARRVVKTGGTILVTDYCVPAPMQARWAGVLVHGVERLAGQAHYRHFRRYMNNGGTDGLLKRAELLSQRAMGCFKGWGGVFVTVGA